MIHQVELGGCAPVPLAHYLKALGILRLVAEQADAQAKGYWRRDRFVLESTLDAPALADYFLRRYQPTPIVAPWNGGSGFAPKDNQTAIRTITAGEAARLRPYKEVIQLIHELRARLGIEEKAEEKKEALLRLCRAELPEVALDWLDAAFLLTEGGPKYPPLLGTGGNDGRLDFTNNFMQRLCAVMDAGSGNPDPESSSWLSNALWGTPERGLDAGSPIGQFFPAAAGGANVQPGYSGDSLINPWDYILMLEGALFFAAAQVKRMGAATPGALSYPFCVRQTGVGYGSAASSDERESRAEMWMPLWGTPAAQAELRALFSEARAQLGARQARNGVDFARSVATLGIDRGIDGFQRYGFQVRNGLAYFATPLNRVSVRRQPQVELLADVDDWLDRFRSRATADTAPAAARRVLRSLDSAIMALCERGSASRVQAVIQALGEAEATMGRSLKWSLGERGEAMRPLPFLSPRWVDEADDGSVEFRLAAALASFTDPLRRHMVPVVRRGDRMEFTEQVGLSVTWGSGAAVDNLISVLARRMLEDGRADVPANPLSSRVAASLGDVCAFIEGRVDDERIAALVGGLNAVRWAQVTNPARGVHSPMPIGAYALIKLCHLPDGWLSRQIPFKPAILNRLAAGDVDGATRLAVQRLRASGYPPALHQAGLKPSLARRLAASLLIPISRYDALERLYPYALDRRLLQKEHQS